MEKKEKKTIKVLTLSNLLTELDRKGIINTDIIDCSKVKCQMNFVMIDDEIFSIDETIGLDHKMEEKINIINIFLTNCLEITGLDADEKILRPIASLLGLGERNNLIPQIMMKKR